MLEQRLESLETLITESADKHAKECARLGGRLVKLEQQLVPDKDARADSITAMDRALSPLNKQVTELKQSLVQEVNDRRNVEGQLGDVWTRLMGQVQAQTLSIEEVSTGLQGLKQNMDQEVTNIRKALQTELSKRSAGEDAENFKENHVALDAQIRNIAQQLEVAVAQMRERLQSETAARIQADESTSQHLLAQDSDVSARLQQLRGEHKQLFDEQDRLRDLLSRQIEAESEMRQRSLAEVDRIRAQHDEAVEQKLRIELSQAQENVRDELNQAVSNFRRELIEVVSEVSRRDDEDEAARAEAHERTIALQVEVQLNSEHLASEHRRREDFEQLIDSQISSWNGRIEALEMNAGQELHGNSRFMKVPDETSLLPDDSSSRKPVVAGVPSAPVFAPLTRPKMSPKTTPISSPRTILSPLQTSPRQMLTQTAKQGVAVPKVQTLQSVAAPAAVMETHYLGAEKIKRQLNR